MIKYYDAWDKASELILDNYQNDNTWINGVREIKILKTNGKTTIFNNDGREMRILLGNYSYRFQYHYNDGPKFKLIRVNRKTGKEKPVTIATFLKKLKQAINEIKPYRKVYKDWREVTFELINEGSY